MMFAHLHAAPQGTSGTLLVPANAVDATALLKARTLLAFFDAHGLLRSVASDDWVMFSSRITDPVDTAINGGDYLANVPYYTHTDIRDQPGVALVRNTFETLTLFRQVYLRSSRDWLRKRPAIDADLRERFLTLV